jgi:hypothetical protein
MTLPWMAARIVLRPAAELRAHPRNARVHVPAQVEQIKASIMAFFTNPLLVDEAGVLIAGDGWLEAAVALDMERVPVIVLRRLSPAQTRSGWPTTASLRTRLGARRCCAARTCVCMSVSFMIGALGGSARSAGRYRPEPRRQPGAATRFGLPRSKGKRD